jgi:hypothetical protein
MSTIHLTTDTIEIRLSPAERLSALHGDLRLPRPAILAAEVVNDGLAAVRGVRAPGVAIPRRLKIGTWRDRHGACFVSVRRDTPSLRLTFRQQRYNTILISTPNATTLAAELNPDQ